MKTRNLQTSLLTCAIFTSIIFAGGIAAAQNTLTTPDGTVAAPLSAGVPEIIELAQANVNDATIVNYIQNSGINYSLRADEVVYLKQQGVSETVVNAMLNQHAPAASPDATSATTATTVNNTYIQNAPVMMPEMAYVQPAPSSVIIIPDSQTSRYDHWYYNHANGFRYGNGYDYFAYHTYPVVSFSAGYGAIRDGHFRHIRHY